MVAVVAGNGRGLLNSSLNTISSRAFPGRRGLLADRQKNRLRLIHLNEVCASNPL